MELKIKNRDYVADGAGGLVRVSGWVKRCIRRSSRASSTVWRA